MNAIPQRHVSIMPLVLTLTVVIGATVQVDTSVSIREICIVLFSLMTGVQTILYVVIFLIIFA